MKIKRFFAEDIRQAMRMVKEELGADAVIMSNKSVDGGVEIVAARDFDEQLIQSKLQKQAAEQQSSAATANYQPQKVELPDFEAEKNRLHVVASPRKQNVDGFVSESAPARTQQRFSGDNGVGRSRNIDQYVGYAEKVHLRGAPDIAAKPVNSSAPKFASTPVAPARKESLNHSARPVEKQPSPVDNLLLEMSKELKSLRSAMDSKLSNVSLAAMAHANPVRADLLQRLAGMSISKKLSVKIANRLNNHTDAEHAFSQAKELLTRVMPIADDDLLRNGGIVALVGPTGVGKTTTIAKLAAKFILKHGPKQVALITTDNYRIGAHEQLNTYGRILDIPVRVASSAAELNNLIHGFSDKRLILIDTAGMSQRGMKLVEQINTLQQSGQPIRSYLVMSAATEYKAMNEIIKAFQVFEPQASILTKLDEAATIGSAVSAIIENNLPVSFIADGQQVPEDMHNACARTLIEQCVAELDDENDYNDVDNEAWVAQGYA